jgi:hypothetical protein
VLIGQRLKVILYLRFLCRAPFVISCSPFGCREIDRDHQQYYCAALRDFACECLEWAFPRPGNLQLIPLRPFCVDRYRVRGIVSRSRREIYLFVPHTRQRQYGSVLKVFYAFWECVNVAHASLSLSQGAPAAPTAPGAQAAVAVLFEIFAVLEHGCVRALCRITTGDGLVIVEIWIPGSH